MKNLESLGTESRNPRTSTLDSMSVSEILAIMNDEDASVATAVRVALPQIAQAIDLIVTAREQGGRLIYLGAGTSGRLGVLDAVECPPTFGTSPDEVVGLIAGGESAFTQAVEGAEDSATAGEQDLRDIALGANDVVVGLAASGRTPYVVGALDYARTVGAATVSVACNEDAEISAHADVAIELKTGPEVLTGSTRLKAGTAQKQVCNMLSTVSMVRTGKVYGNLMVDMMPTNAKLVDRAQRIVAAAGETDLATAGRALEDANGHAKTAVVMIKAGCTAEEAATLLHQVKGDVRSALRLRGVGN
ncbi:N-acetylmuramic acid 6-phosphate etherase [Arthrobacter tecti]